MDFYINEDTVWFRRTVGWAVNIVVALACAWFLVYSFGGRVHVSGNSMQPVLDADDIVLLNRLAYDIVRPERFDIVVFDQDGRKQNVKRVIGLPGETVQILEGTVYIDGQPLDAEDDLEKVSLAGRANEPVLLAADEYFLLGDNRDSSEDSRFKNIGNVKREQIAGKVWLRLFPILKLNLISS